MQDSSVCLPGVADGQLIGGGLAFRFLIDAGVVRQQLRRQPDRDLALIVSAAVHDEVIKTRFHGLSPGTFSRVTVQAKGLAYMGYLYQGDFAGTAPQIPAMPAGS